MSEPASFDPYEQWLGIEPHEQPADHYRLLGLARFETDRWRIIAAADQRMAHVRCFQTGPRGALTQKLLNELAAARVCLLDAQTKAVYDAALAGQLSALEAQRRMAAMQPQPDVLQSVAPPPNITPKQPARGRRRPAINPWPAFGLFCSVVLVILIAALAFLLARSPFHPGGRSHTAKAAAETLRQPQPRPIAESAPPSPVIEPERNGDVIFPARLAQLSGDLGREEIGSQESLVFHSPRDEASWDFRTEKGGYFRAELLYALDSSTEDTELELIVGERVKRCSLRSSGGLDQFHSDTVTVAVPQSGKQKLVIRARNGAASGLALREVRFMPISAKLTTGGR